MDTFVEKNWTNMIRPVALEGEAEVSNPSYGKFVARPLERGYGQTLGNMQNMCQVSRDGSILRLEPYRVAFGQLSPHFGQQLFSPNKALYSSLNPS